MKVSIITPTYNSEQRISQNINSILHQSHHDFEHIIVDNESTDATISIAKQLYRNNNLEDKLRVICEKDMGIADAFNKGIKSSTGDIIGILNSDDHYFDNTVLHKVITAFKKKNVLIVHGNIDFVDSVFGSNVRKPLRSNVLDVILNHPGMFARKEVYSDVGLYDIDFRYSMDYEFYCRLKKKYTDIEGISEYLNIPLVTMNAGGASWKNELSSVHEIKKALQEHNLWDFYGVVFYLGRILRIKLKHYITIVGLSLLIKHWRNFKWGQ